MLAHTRRFNSRTQALRPTHVYRAMRALFEPPGISALIRIQQIGKQYA